MQVKNIVLIVISIWLSIQVVIAQEGIAQRGGTAGLQSVDRIVAQVGDQIVLYSDIEIQKLQLLQQGVQLPMDVDCRILEEMLYQNLLAHQAKVDSIVISDEQVNYELDNRLRQLEGQVGSRELLEQYFGKTYAQIKAESRDNIRDNLLAERMEEVITKDIEATPRDVRRFFQKIPADSLPMVGEQVALQQIVIYPKVSQREKSQTIDELKRIKNSIQSGSESFESAARRFSQDPGSKQQGGRIAASRGQMVKPFESALFKLSVGEISDVVETEYGFHIIQLIDRKGDDYTIRHILRIPEVSRSAINQASALVDECFSRIRDGELTWEQAVIEYSEDKATKQNQGSLVNPYTGELFWDIRMIAQFDEELAGTVIRMNPGDVSEPMIFEDMQKRSPAVRMVKVRQRMAEHQANLKDDYVFIKRAAENQKKEDAILNWVEETASKAFIKIDDKFSRCNFMYNWK